MALQCILRHCHHSDRRAPLALTSNLVAIGDNSDTIKVYEIQHENVSKKNCDVVKLRSQAKVEPSHEVCQETFPHNSDRICSIDDLFANE
jgi:hypothetical protein